ncbi:MAG: trypsin-like serine protease [Oscillibacter sp.]|nr:trypsin-like serine protease [Oscillibacter sp.]
MYNNEQDKSQYEYHYSYQPSVDTYKAPAPMELKPRGRGKKIVALALCGALLIGGAFGAGWYLNNHRTAAAPSVPAGDVNDTAAPGDEGQLYVSDRPETEIGTVAVTGGEKLTFAQVYQANVDSCVSINTQAMATVGYNIFGQQIQREAASSGSGFILTSDGYIATNCHVVSNATAVQVTLNNGKSYAAEVVGSDSDYDIAVLKIDPGEDTLKPVVLGSSVGLNVGEDVSTIGNPLGELTFSMSRGMVSCLDRAINLEGTPFNMIQIDTAINPGNSGGPLFNAYGEVVGIVTAKTSSTGSGTAAEGLGFAIPIDDVRDLIKDIMENGKVTSRAYMGVTRGDAANYPECGVRSGAYLVSVVEDGPADKAGLKAGDVITMLGTTTITSGEDLSTAVSSSKVYKAGDTTTVTYVREGKVYTTELTFGSTLEMPETTASQPADPQQPDGYGDSYDYDYGNMEDFFEQFFGGSYGYGRRAA